MSVWLKKTIESGPQQVNTPAELAAECRFFLGNLQMANESTVRLGSGTRERRENEVLEYLLDLARHCGVAVTPPRHAASGLEEIEHLWHACTGGARAGPVGIVEVDGDPWSTPDTPTRWAAKFGVNRRTFTRWANAKDAKIRVKKLTDRTYQVRLSDLPQPSAAPASGHKWTQVDTSGHKWTNGRFPRDTPENGCIVGE